MELSSDQLDMLEKAGEALLNVEQAALIIEVDAFWLNSQLEVNTTQAYKRYYKGYFISLMKVRTSIIKLAARGSFPAQQLLQKLIDKQG